MATQSEKFPSTVMSGFVTTFSSSFLGAAEPARACWPYVTLWRMFSVTVARPRRIPLTLRKCIVLN